MSCLLLERELAAAHRTTSHGTSAEPTAGLRGRRPNVALQNPTHPGDKNHGDPLTSPRKSPTMLLVLELTGFALTTVVHVIRALRRSA